MHHGQANAARTTSLNVVALESCLCIGARCTEHLARELQWPKIHALLFDASCRPAFGPCAAATIVDHLRVRGVEYQVPQANPVYIGQIAEPVLNHIGKSVELARKTPTRTE